MPLKVIRQGAHEQENDHTSTEFFWIDQVCINQFDADSKNPSAEITEAAHVPHANLAACRICAHRVAMSVGAAIVDSAYT